VPCRAEECQQRGRGAQVRRPAVHDVLQALLQQSAARLDDGGRQSASSIASFNEMDERLDVPCTLSFVPAASDVSGSSVLGEATRPPRHSYGLSCRLQLQRLYVVAAISASTGEVLQMTMG